jgi:cytochrome bd-type quinol oxidase subunit 2
MDGDVGGYVLVLAFGTAITLLVAQILIRAGEGFLDEVFDEEKPARSLSQLLAVLFLLVALGLVALVSTKDVEAKNLVEVVIIKLGLVMLIEGAILAVTLAVMARIRGQRRAQMVAARAQQATANGRQAPDGMRAIEIRPAP